jgi:hypothetical protein
VFVQKLIVDFGDGFFGVENCGEVDGDSNVDVG